MTRFAHLNHKSFLLAATMLATPLLAAMPTVAHAQIGISVQVEPPALPVYVQPPIPAEGYLWTPGYWGYGSANYYWVPGLWVQPPMIGVLWTPPYWGWAGGNYLFHGGYWGAQVGFYGGVNYGFGYGGNGYEGGHWEGGHFAYNSRVNNFGGVHVANSYERNVSVVNDSHVSFVGGPHGLRAEPTAADRMAENQHHIEATTEQSRHFATAAHTPAASHDQEHPAAAATPRAGPVGHAVEPAARATLEHTDTGHTEAARETPHANVQHAVHHTAYRAHHTMVHAAVATRPVVAHAAPHEAQHAAPRPAEHAPPTEHRSEKK